MKNRLTVAKELLSTDRVIFISINDEEQAYLKVLCDEVFDRENFVEKTQKAKTKEELTRFWETMKKKAFLSYKVDVKAVDEHVKDFADLSIEDQKKFLLQCLDKNHLYVNYSEIDDEKYGVSEEDKRINKEFYQT